ncbi:MAG TPA: hypothetical protein VJ765_03415 [Chitinophagaceae bacterium]|nr:hypothetical protein [Chitinophagaceae bacterium]
MVTKHLTDEEIQFFAFDKANYESVLAGHIHACPECKAKVETYQLLMKAISRQPQPAFDFDLSAAVLGQLPVSRPGAANDRLLVWIFIFLSGSLIGTTVYFCRGYFDSIFRGITGISIYLMSIPAMTVIAILFVEMYKKYQKEMRVLDL